MKVWLVGTIRSDTIQRKLRGVKSETFKVGCRIPGEVVRQEEGLDIAGCQVPVLPFALARGEENPLRLSILLSEILEPG